MQQQRSRDKPLVAIHLPHGGGTFVCAMASQNCEVAYTKYACACLNDLPRMPHEIRGCAERRQMWTNASVSFAQVERGLETGEFCPDVADYMLLVSDPIARMDSVASGYRHTVSLATLMGALANGTRMGLQLYSTEYFSEPSASDHLAARHGEGLVQFDNLLVRTLAADSRWLHAGYVILR